MAFYRRVLAVAVLGSGSVLSSSLLAGCGSFFSCEGKTSCTGTTTVTNTGNFVYVSDSPSGPTYISGYSLATGVLTSITGADIDLGFVPVAMVVAPSNGFLYVASSAGATNPGVYVYTIGSTGALTLANNGNPFFTDSTIASMDVSPDGNFLYTLGSSTIAGAVLSQYSMDTTTGLPTVDNPNTIPTNQVTLGACSLLNSGTPLSQVCSVKVSPNENYVGVALGNYGFEVFPYTSTGGVANTPQLSPSTTFAAFSLAFDTNNYLYVASTKTDGTGALTSYSGLSAATITQDAQATYASAVTPRSVTVLGAKYVYTANEATGTISGFSLPGSGALTSMGAAVPGPTNVSALGIDKTGDYLLAAGFNATNGLQVFTIGSTGALSSAGTPYATGAYDSTDAVPIVIALSH